jgi:predicted signal transduction protein with EAL and GGDEF domain
VSPKQAHKFVQEVVHRFEIVVAEGIEDPNACAELAALGISHVQGFGIARPAPELRSEASVAALTRRTEGGAPRGRLPSAGIGMTADDEPSGWSSR